MGLLGMSPAAVLAQGLPLPPSAPDNTVPVQVAPPSQEVVQTGGDRSLKPRDILKDGVENHRKFEFELADVFLKKAQELRGSLSASEQKELDAYVQSNAKALASRKQGQEMIQKATLAINAGKYQEADVLLRTLKANTYLGTQDRQNVVTLADVLAKNTGTVTAPGTTPVAPKGRTPADMLVAGREAFKNKNYDEAQSWAISSKQAGYSAKMPWEDTPDKLMNDINVARAQAAKMGTTPGGADQRQQQCKALCMQASQALAAGDVVTAKKLTKQAEDLKVNVAWFDEYTPAKLNEAIARAEKSGVRPGTMVAGAVPADPKQAVKEARVALDQGNLDRAEELCNSARVAKVSWGFFDDTPDKVLADVRKSREVVNGKKAADLLVQARRHLETGNLDEAEKCCAQSKMLKKEYGLMDGFGGERPDKLMVEIQNKKAVASRNKPATSTNVAVNTPGVGVVPQGSPPPMPPVNNAPPVNTASNNVPAANLMPPVTPRVDSRVAEANRLMAEARMDLNKGNYDAALQKADTVKKMGVVTQENPDSIYQAVQMAAKVKDQRNSPVADAKRMKAQQLLANARVMTKTGDIMGAHKAVTEAKSMGVVFQQGDELPEAVLADLQVKARQQVETYTKAADTLVARGKAGEAQQYRNYVMNLAMTFNVPAPQMGSTVPGTLVAPNATDVAGQGKKLCTDIEQCVREGQLVQARKLANALYEGPYGMKSQAGQFLAQIDAADMKASVKTSEQYYDLVVKAVNRKEYDLAKSYAEKIDRKLLDQAKAKHLNELLSTPAGDKNVIQMAQGVVTPDGKSSSPMLDDLRKKHEIESQRLNEVKNNSLARASKLSQQGNFEAALTELKATLEMVKKADVDVPNVTAMTRQLETKIKTYEKVYEQVAFEKEAREKLESKQNSKLRKVADEENRRTQVAALMTEYTKFMKEGKFADAEARAEKAHRIDPDNPAIDAARQQAKMQNNLSNEHNAVNNGRDQWTIGMTDIGGKAVVGDDKPVEYTKDFARVGQERINKVKARMNRDRGDELPNSSKLSTTISVDFRNRPLDEVVGEVRTLSGGLNIILEQTALQYAGIDSNMPVTLTLNNVSVKTVLNAVLNQAQLTYYVKEGIIYVTTKEARASHKQTRTFGVHDLIVPRDDMANLTNVNRDAGVPVSTNGSTSGREGYDPPANNGQWQTRRTGATLEKQLIQMITSTIAPETWKGTAAGGTGTIEYYPMGMTLVVSQSSDIQEQIEELIRRLRELQEVQITVEVRILTLTDDFFERMGVDFNVSIPDKQTSFDQQVASGNFAPNGMLNYPDHTKGVIVGLTPAGNFTNNLNIPVSNDSFRAARLPTGFAGIGAPGNAGGLDVGVAFLSSIQVFLVMEAVQGDIRNSTLQAPKITMFNGQASSISSTTQELFVTSVQATPNFFTGIPVFTPVQQIFPSGTVLTVQAVVTNDRRYVQLTLQPFITTVTDRSRSFTAVAGITVQQPVTSTITLATTVMVPDGGTILVGGLKQMNEQRREFGPPILSKIPYVNRLFRNQSYGKSATSLMFMVTPRIIINEEEEEKLGSTFTF
jgi:Flp pilus assembly secretin CpaC/tetratricopeptide (TPR) repeat protein